MKIFPIMCSPFVRKTPIELLFKRITLMRCQKTFVLKSANYDARSNANRLCEAVYRVVRERFFSDEVGQRAGRDEQVSREAIGFCLEPLHFGIDNLVGQIFNRIINDEGALVPVEQDVSDFMKQSKPKLIVSFIP